MGNEQSSSSGKKRRSSNKNDTATDQAKNLVGDAANYISKSYKKLEEDGGASKLIDSMCGPIFEDRDRMRRSHSYDYTEGSDYDSRTLSYDETVDEYDRRKKHGSKSKQQVNESESSSAVSQSDFEESEISKSKPSRKSRSSNRRSDDSTSFESAEDDEQSGLPLDDTVLSGATSLTDGASDAASPSLLSKPLASSFAKRCYFTKAGIGKTTQHYEGLTLTGNVVLMLAAAMKLKGCPTICDEDLRRVEQTYPNQFSRLPDELLLSSGWRRISKYCHFSNKPIPDGVPFFHSKRRVHPNGGYYFLLAAAVGMIRPSDIEPLTRDTLVLLETDYPSQSDQVPEELIEDAGEWTLVDKFCFFSGGPINTEEDVYYQADFEGNLIYMLAFLSPSLTPEELYKLSLDENDEPGLKHVRDVEEVESVYDLTERDFEDLRLYHLGPCRALPPYILQPEAWTKVLPPHFLIARQTALMRAELYEQTHGAASTTMDTNQAVLSPERVLQQSPPPPPPPGGPLNYGSPRDGSLPEQGHFPSQQVEEWDAPRDWGNEGPMPSPIGSPGHFQEGAFYEGGQPYPPAGEPFPQHKGFAPIQSLDSNEPPGPPHQERFNYYEGSQGVDPFTGEASQQQYQREMEEEGAFLNTNAPIDEAIATRSMARSSPGSADPNAKMDPPVDEPPSLSKRGGRDDAPDDEQIYQRDSYPNSQVRSPQDEYYSPDNVQRGVQVEYGNEGRYYRDGEYYDSPEKRQEYYPREGEGYYTPNGRGHVAYAPDDGAFPRADDFVPSSRGALAPPPEADEYFSPDTGFSEPGFSPREGDQPGYFSSPGYTEASETTGDTPPGKENAVAESGAYNATSPESEGHTVSTEYSQPSTAMRSAQDLLRKNRQKRLDMARRRQAQDAARSHNDDAASQSTFDSHNSELMGGSTVSGSSGWTDNDSTQPADRSSRRALILQMAKARMKTKPHLQQQQHAEDKTKSPIVEESPSAMNDASTVSKDVTKGEIAKEERPEDEPLHQQTEVKSDVNTSEIDFAAELD